MDEWFVNYHPTKAGAAVGMAEAVGCCVEESVSFHYVGPMEARALAGVLYDGKGKERCVRAPLFVRLCL